MWCVFAGSLLMLCCTFVIVLPVTTATCMALPWLEHLATGTIITAILLKTLRCVLKCVPCAFVCA